MELNIYIFVTGWGGGGGDIFALRCLSHLLCTIAVLQYLYLP